MNKTLLDIFTELHNSDSFFRFENHEDGYCLSIISRNTYPRVWADNFASGNAVIKEETTEHMLQRTIMGEPDWSRRICGETIEEIVNEYYSI